MDTTITVERTPAVIAAEINSIKDQTRTMILCNSIEIGRRLVEAKALLPHGEWGKWLETSVQYSQSTANNLMRIYEEYGAKQFSLFGNHQAKSKALAKLSYTQAVALLAIPEAERDEFMQEHDVENMSTRELQQAIKERNDALEKLKLAQNVAEEKTDEALKLLSEKQQIEAIARTTEQVLRQTQADIKMLQETLEKERADAKKRTAELQKKIVEARSSGNDEEVKKLQESLKKTAGELNEANRKIVELDRQLKEKPIDVPAVVEKIPEEVQKELETLRKTAGNKTIVKYSVHFENLVKGFKELLGTLEELKGDDLALYEQYKGAVLGLINKMAERLR